MSDRNSPNRGDDALSSMSPANIEASGVSGVMGATREMSEVQAAMVVAQARPRDQKRSMDRIMTACARPGLAATALYEYQRGGSAITGPSIRLAEALAQGWGNISYGIRELEQRGGESTVEAFAWDLETNVRQSKTFQVPHIRYTKNGAYDLSDPRDIYEMVANQGARRVRACILGVMPGDIVEAAVEACEQTQRTHIEVTPEVVGKLVDAFGQLGVSKGQIEKRIQRHLDAITPGLIVQLRKIYTSLKDGMSSVSDWFDADEDAGAPGDAPKTLDDLVDAAGAKAEGTEEAPADAEASEPDASDDTAPDTARDEWLSVVEEHLERLGKTERAAVLTNHAPTGLDSLDASALEELATKLETLV